MNAAYARVEDVQKNVRCANRLGAGHPGQSVHVVQAKQRSDDVGDSRKKREVYRTVRIRQVAKRKRPQSIIYPRIHGDHPDGNRAQSTFDDTPRVRVRVRESTPGPQTKCFQGVQVPIANGYCWWKRIDNDDGDIRSKARAVPPSASFPHLEPKLVWEPFVAELWEH